MPSQLFNHALFFRKLERSNSQEQADKCSSDFKISRTELVFGKTSKKTDNAFANKIRSMRKLETALE